MKYIVGYQYVTGYNKNILLFTFQKMENQQAEQEQGNIITYTDQPRL